jgi:hypothetical protein
VFKPGSLAGASSYCLIAASDRRIRIALATCAREPSLSVGFLLWGWRYFDEHLRLHVGCIAQVGLRSGYMEPEAGPENKKGYKRELVTS